MPSKKKKKSKGRGKAAKKADEQQRSLDMQMERLKIDKDEDSQTNADEDALLEDAIKLAAAEKEALDAEAAEKEDDQLKVCHHGNAVETKELIHFINTFISVASGQNSPMIASLSAANDIVKEKYPDVW